MGENRSQFELEPDIAGSGRNHYKRKAKSAVAERKQQQLLYLSQADVEAIGLSMAEIIMGLDTRFARGMRAACRCHRSPALKPGQARSFMPCWRTSLR